MSNQFCKYFWTPAFRRKGVLWFHHCQYVSMLVGKHVFSKGDHMIWLFWKVSWVALRVKNWQSWIFDKKSHGRDYAPKHPQNRVFSILQKKKKDLLMCRILGFKSCTIMTFMILLKPHVWENFGSWVKCKNALSQSDWRIFKLEYLKNYLSYKVDFLHAGACLLFLQIDGVILHD